MKKYEIHICRECDVDFATFKRDKRKSTYCTECGDSIATEYIKTVEMEILHNSVSRWTKTEIDIAMYGNKKGLTYKQVAEELKGRSPKAIKHKVNEIKNMEKNK